MHHARCPVCKSRLEVDHVVEAVTYYWPCPWCSTRERSDRVILTAIAATGCGIVLAVAVLLHGCHF